MSRYLILFFTVFLTVFQVQAQDFPEPMQPRRLVNDFTRMFSPQQQAALEQKLRNFNDTTSTQIAVVTVPSLNGYGPNDYAQRLAEKWGIGQKGKDNGILLLIKPKTGNERGQVAISVGYGLEGAVPDAIASRIIQKEILPEFQNGNYYKGADKATNVLMGLTSGEYTADQYSRGDKGRSIAWLLIPFGLIFLLPWFIRRRPGDPTNTNNRGSVGGGPFIFWGGMGGRGFGGGGGFSGGGFGGFGGGGFGGGGASGSW